MIKPEGMSCAEAKSYVEEVEREYLTTLKQVEISNGRDRVGEYVDVKGYTKGDKRIIVRIARDTSFEQENRDSMQEGGLHTNDQA